MMSMGSRAWQTVNFMRCLLQHPHMQSAGALLPAQHPGQPNLQCMLAARCSLTGNTAHVQGRRTEKVGGEGRKGNVASALTIALKISPLGNGVMENKENVAGEMGRESKSQS